ncbi:hypothetical protein [Niveispirillum fermenti]|uniref:hypothetical protein n=1 Tax=Niveispirillum fermenti TaxID=1233113 RepID=UPI003A87F374
MAETLFTLLHLLILVYWLGGDLGAFYSSSILTDAKATPPQRATALRILMAVDMAPRTALILALPTGLTLGVVKGWLPDLGLPALLAVWAVGLVWLALAWAVHMNHGKQPWQRQADLVIRWAALLGCAGFGLAGMAGLLFLPHFIAAKLLILATAISLGLLIRLLLRPLMAPFGQMMAGGATPETDAAIKGVLARTRPVVMLLWLLLLMAALLGLGTPT